MKQRSIGVAIGFKESIECYPIKNKTNIKGSVFRAIFQKKGDFLRNLYTSTKES